MRLDLVDPESVVDHATTGTEQLLQLVECERPHEVPDMQRRALGVPSG